eukprot:8142133-Alexandrium_andersonii.AAC.1
MTTWRKRMPKTQALPNHGMLNGNMGRCSKHKDMATPSLTKSAEPECLECAITQCATVPSWAAHAHCFNSAAMPHNRVHPRRHA